MDPRNLVSESNPLIDPDTYHRNVTYKIEGGGAVDWSSSQLKRIIRMRFLSDPGFPFWDLSYCHGEMIDGSIVRVALPFYQLKKGRSIISQIIEYAKKDNVFAKGLGIFNAISTLQ